MNWQTVIQELRDAGMTLRAIAEETGTGLTTISEIARGATKEPRGNLAAQLTRLHATHGAVTRYELRPDVFGEPSKHEVA